jgi:hypothetical protein
MSDATLGTLEDRDEAGTGESGKARFWRMEIESARKFEREWRREGVAIVERYRGNRSPDDSNSYLALPRQKQFNILWSNTETLKSAILSATPEPVVRRRFLDKDPVGRAASEVLERALSFLVEDTDFDDSVGAARDDMLLPGRGTVRVVYEADFDRVDVPPIVDAFGMAVVDEDGAPVYAEGVEVDEDGGYVEEIGDQRVYLGYIYWQDVLISPARRWDDVRWIAIRHRMTRAELRERFGTEGIHIPLTNEALPGDEAIPLKKDPNDQQVIKRATVWEIWDHTNKRQVWMADGASDVLLEEDDPLGLDGFFPIPKPLLSITTTDTMVPVPEFMIYKAQADELDRVTSRISSLIEALKVRGLYAGTIKAFEDLLSDGDENKLYPLEDWQALLDGGGLDRMIAYLPIEKIAQVVAGLVNYREQLKQEIFELTGMSDLIRGSSNPSETATAQKLKSSFGMMRMTPRQRPMQEFIRGGLRLLAEIVSEHFTQKNLLRMTGLDLPDQEKKMQAQMQAQAAQAQQQPVPDEVTQILESPTWEDVIALLRRERLREFRISVSTESMVSADQEADKQNITEFMKVSTDFLTATIQMAQVAPETANLNLEIYKFAARRFKASRELESVIDDTAEQISSRVRQQMNAPPQPSPEQIRAQAEEKKAAMAGQEAQRADQAAQRRDAIGMKEAEMRAQVETRGQNVRMLETLAKD